jgi:DNA-binding transcriptional LysR family regulator
VLDWNDLRVALAIARTGSLSAAAAELGVHQTTAGRRLSALEEELGFSIFLRTPTGLHATAEGARVLAPLEDLAGSLNRFEHDARDAKPGAQGLVRIAVTEAAARQLLESTIPALQSEYPELSIELVPANVASDLARGDADFAIRLLKPEDGLLARRLGFVRYGLYGSKEYLARHRGAERPGLEGHTIVVPSRELAKGPEAQWMTANARAAKRALYASSLLTLALAVERGLGLCVLPTNLAKMHAKIELVRDLPEVPPRAVWLVLHPDLKKSTRVRVVADAFADEMRRRLA